MRFRPLQDKTLVVHAGGLSGGCEAAACSGGLAPSAFQALPARGSSSRAALEKRREAGLRV
ncbi:hypothetical protein ACFQY9_25280 [Microvirga aerilata]|uniref:hypothetical protein n=1 Tax=Microvirga aerilata TaxID=670292 RepID=UPI00362624FB